MSRPKTPAKSVSPVPLSMMFDESFVIRNSLDAQGVFARMAIKKNTMVHNDCFVWVVNDSDDKRSKKDMHKSYETQWANVCQQFSTRVPQLQEAIKELEPKHAPGQAIGAWLEAVLKINGWDHYLQDERVTMLAIYKGSKYNHSCAPTLHVSLSDAAKGPEHITPPETNQPGVRNEFWVTALEDILKDDEVTVSYLHGDDLKGNDFKKRRALLQKSWGFVCNCKKCQSDIALEKDAIRLAALSKSASTTKSKSTGGRMGSAAVVLEKIANNKRKDAEKQQPSISKAKQQTQPKKPKLFPALVTPTPPSQSTPSRRVKLVATLPASHPATQTTTDIAADICSSVLEPPPKTSKVASSDAHDALKTQKDLQMPQAIHDHAQRASNFVADSAVTSLEQDAQLMFFASQLARTPAQFAQLAPGSLVHANPIKSDKAAKTPRSPHVKKSTSTTPNPVPDNDARNTLLAQLNAFATLDSHKPGQYCGLSQLTDDDKLLWVDCHSTPRGWLVMLSPHGLQCATNNEALDNDNLAKIAQWKIYAQAWRAQLAMDKTSWTQQEQDDCAIDQGIYERRLIRDLKTAHKSRTEKLELAMQTRTAALKAVEQCMITSKTPRKGNYRSAVSLWNNKNNLPVHADRTDAGVAAECVVSPLDASMLTAFKVAVFQEAAANHMGIVNQNPAAYEPAMGSGQPATIATQLDTELRKLALTSSLAIVAENAARSSSAMVTSPALDDEMALSPLATSPVDGCRMPWSPMATSPLLTAQKENRSPTPLMPEYLRVSTLAAQPMTSHSYVTSWFVPKIMEFLQICQDILNSPQQDITAQGVVCVLFRLIQYYQDLPNYTPPDVSRVNLLTRLQLYARAFYSLLCVKSQHCGYQVPSISDCYDGEALAHVSKLLLHDNFTFTAVRELSSISTFRRHELVRHDTLQATHDAAWWHDTLKTHLANINNTPLVASGDTANFCLLLLLFQSTSVEPASGSGPPT